MLKTQIGTSKSAGTSGTKHTSFAKQRHKTGTKNTIFARAHCPYCDAELKVLKCFKCGLPLVIFTWQMCEQFYGECFGHCKEIHWICVECKCDEFGKKLNADERPQCWKDLPDNDDEDEPEPETDNDSYIEE